MFSYVIASTDMLSVAAANVAGIGSSLSAATAVAGPSTTAVIAAAEDEVSAAVASLFSSHAREYQALSDQAAAFHAKFVQALTGAGGSYGAAEATNAAAFQAVEHGALAAVNALAEGLFGRPIIGNGTNGAAGTGQAGGAGGILGAPVGTAVSVVSVARALPVRTARPGWPAPWTVTVAPVDC